MLHVELEEANAIRPLLGVEPLAWINDATYFFVKEDSKVDEREKLPTVRKVERREIQRFCTYPTEIFDQTDQGRGELAFIIPSVRVNGVSYT